MILDGGFLGGGLNDVKAMKIDRCGPVDIPIGKILGKRWKITKRLGAGGCGAVYMAGDQMCEFGMAALKAESNFVPGGSVLKMEVDILQRLDKKEHFGRLLGSGKRETFQYMVMTLFGESLQDIIKRVFKLSISTTIRMAIHVLRGLKSLHDIGFVHRDIKPANLAIGRSGPETRVVHIFDFGLAREFVVRTEGGSYVMRRARTNVNFRGTTRYCSLATHDKVEQGRVDDLWTLLYVTVECRENLPWTGIRDKKLVAESKRNCSDFLLLKELPVQMLEYTAYLRTLNYYSRPDYTKLFRLLMSILEDGGMNMWDQWDWEKFRNPKANGPEDETTKAFTISESDFTHDAFGF